MRVPLDWLREYCDPDLDARGIEERLTMTGTKVEAIHHHGVQATGHFVVGRTIEVKPHPDADRLRVCTVDVGAGGDPVTIVCGAPNVASNQTVAVALPGAVMPDGTKIKRAKLRGVPSEGMILSESELQISAGAEGILVLEDALPNTELRPGTPLEQALLIATEVLELEITPNRPDCLGVYGVARELHAATGVALNPAPYARDSGTPGQLEGIDVEVLCPELCPRFTARIFENVEIAPSPPWLKARLMAAGQRPINNVVDITNYAMLLSGQPLHAFDLDRLAGQRLTVRRASPGETVDTLDGQTRSLDNEMVLIADAEGPSSIAGVMGGRRSEVASDTKRVLLEVATWDGPNIHRTSWALGLRSEASSRFEKGLQPEQCMHAQAIATDLMIELCGANVLPGTIDIGSAPPERPVLSLRESRVQAILGVPVTQNSQREILSALDFETEPVAGGLKVTVPALRRQDVTREIDLIEEVARIAGVDQLPVTLPARRGAVGLLSHAQRVRRAAEDTLVGYGLSEIVGWSFTDPGLLDRLRIPDTHPMRRTVTVENPLSEAQSVMRPTLLGSLLNAAAHNVSRGRADLAIFESGTVYRASEQGPLAHEHHALAALLIGDTTPVSWRGGSSTSADFFTAKAVLGAVLDTLHVPWSVRPGSWPFLHPGRSADIHLGNETLGFLGEIHPLISGTWDLPRTAVFAIDLGRLAKATPEVLSFQAFASVPPLRQDIAVTLPADVAAEEVLKTVAKAAGSTLDRVEVFDVYTGPQVEEGKRSLALALTFQDAERTLTDEDIAPLRAKILKALEQQGGELRGQ
jgi:phenylalanyl-tRNA synthetase beta chain